MSTETAGAGPDSIGERAAVLAVLTTRAQHLRLELIRMAERRRSSLVQQIMLLLIAGLLVTSLARQVAPIGFLALILLSALVLLGAVDYFSSMAVSRQINRTTLAPLVKSLEENFKLTSALVDHATESQPATITTRTTLRLAEIELTASQGADV